MQCEMCGREAETVPALIEGVELQACAACARHGQILNKPVFVQPKKKIVIAEPELRIVPNYAQLIKRKREELGLVQEDFAKMVKEKASTMHSIESGRIKPDLQLAQKLKKAFGLNLIEEIKNEKVKTDKLKTNGFTFGDFIKKG